MKKEESPKFEDKLRKLEELVRKMESGGVSLDEMIAAFEEGRRLVEECRKDLEGFRLKIEKVTASGGVENVNVKPDGDVDL